MESGKKKYTILLLSAPIGSGHRLAAEALVEVLQQQEDVEVIHGNIFDFFPHFLGTAFLRSYLWILGCCPWLYELAYKWGDRQGGSLWLRTLLNRLLAALGSSFLNRVKPDAVVATHATPAGIMCYYKEKHPEVFLGAVVTDYTIHQWWLCQGVDAYFIADEKLRSKISVPAKVLSYGIPVREQFLHNDGAYWRGVYGWPQQEKVCLLMGGGEGLLPMEELVESLSRARISNLHVVAITGHNERLAEKLRQRFGSDKHLEIYGFREDVPQMMAAADMIITKAGGLTSAEVLTSRLDFVIYKPLPGQEQGNASFLRDNCGVEVATDVHELIEAVKGLCKLDRGTAAAHCYGKPEAAQKISAYVLQKIRK